jgi:hypothetical protein
MPDFEEGRTETVDMDSPADVTEVMANTPVAVALLEVFTSNPRPSRFDSPSQRRSRLFAVVRRRSCRFEKRGCGPRADVAGGAEG